MNEELLPSEQIAQARAMWASAFWQRMLVYLLERRAALLAATDPPADTRAIWLREGAVAEINRLLRGDSLMLDVVKAAAKRMHEADVNGFAEPLPAEPAWMHAGGAGTLVS